MQVLLLDQTYEPLRTISFKKAMSMLVRNKAEIVEESDEQVSTFSAMMRFPSIIRQFAKYQRKTDVKFSRINIYLRDDFTCQYCGEKKRAQDLTFDHVLPRCQGGQTTWDNIVTACRACNGAKDGRTPQQARMRLLRLPVKPKWLPKPMTIRLKSMPKQWEPYLDAGSASYWTVELES